MNFKDCKEGVRVYWKGGEYNPPDSGIIISKNDSIWYSDSLINIWVKWDSNNTMQWIDYESLDLEDPSEQITEEQAVMFLLSKGYTVSKGN